MAISDCDIYGTIGNPVRHYYTTCYSIVSLLTGQGKNPQNLVAGVAGFFGRACTAYVAKRMELLQSVVEPARPAFIAISDASQALQQVPVNRVLQN